MQIRILTQFGAWLADVWFSVRQVTKTSHREVEGLDVPKEDGI